MSTATFLEQKALRGAERRPAWEVALLFPDQGTWSVTDYLDLPGNQLVEYDNGCIEVLPMPSIRHQNVSMNIAVPLRVYAETHESGKVLCAPMPVQVAPSKFREPDVIFCQASANYESDEAKHLNGADFVVEIVSEGAANRKRDLVDKRIDYAAAGIAEYWVVDPERQEVTVLLLQGGEYVESGTFGIHAVVQSTAVSGFEIPVAKVFAK